MSWLVPQELQPFWLVLEVDLHLWLSCQQEHVCVEADRMHLDTWCILGCQYFQSMSVDSPTNSPD